MAFQDKNGDGIIDPASEVVQVNAYYPFGLNHGANVNGAGGAYKYQYNGKEFDDDLGLNWNDYGARFYDAAIGRWNSVDPSSEKQETVTGYHYVYNNPVKSTDPDGREPETGDECCGGRKEIVAGLFGSAVGFVDNILGTQLRESVGQSAYGSNGILRENFDNGVAQADQASLVGGTIMAVDGLKTAGVGVGVALTGVGAPEGAVIAIGGLAEAGIGGLMANNAKNNLLKANEKQEGNNNQGSGTGRGRNNRKPDPDAKGDHSVKDKNGNTTYKLNEKNPSRFDEVKKTDVKGKEHTNPDATKVPTPHVSTKGKSGVVPAVKGKDY